LGLARLGFAEESATAMGRAFSYSSATLIYPLSIQS
jgi:hypothetical protein